MESAPFHHPTYAVLATIAPPPNRQSRVECLEINTGYEKFNDGGDNDVRSLMVVVVVGGSG
jgi:hypothetical protein